MRSSVTTPLVLLCAVALAGVSRGAEDDAKATPAQPLVMTAEQLASAYSADQVAANRKYKDKAVLLDGEVLGVTPRDKSCSILSLNGGPGLFKVACLFDDPASVAKLAKGQKVKVRGDCRGVCGAVVVEGCQIVEVSPRTVKGPR
jgi:hypothetical protein